MRSRFSIERGLHDRISFLRKSSQPVLPGCSIRSAHVDSTPASSDDAGAFGRRVIFSGVQPTGIPHLGNYLGAFKPWLKWQREKRKADELNFSIVDLHALTVPQHPAQLTEWRWDTYLALLAVGLDPNRCRIFFQSDIPAHSQLMWMLATKARTGYLSRMTQWKSKLNLEKDATLQESDADSPLEVGLFTYPVLQAADILLYRTTHVPIGEDQLQHIEFTRKLARRFNHIYGDMFTIPEPVISPAKRIMSLTDPTKKMSKSDPDPNSRILITDDEQTIRQKFRGALTDSQDSISYSPENRPGVSNLLDLLKHTLDEDVSSHELAAQLRTSNLRLLKETVAHEVSRSLRETRERFLELRSRPDSLLEDMSLNQSRASATTSQMLEHVRHGMGVARF